MSVKAALELLLSAHKRVATISRPGTTLSGEIWISPSNYFRRAAFVENIVVDGSEFIILKSQLDAISFPKPRRGDKLQDSSLGTLTITDVMEMFDFGGEIVGYRVRTG